MLSYRHAYHAGNPADVLKHLTLVQIAQYLASKDKPFWIIDTHAGAGSYKLDSPLATKLGEHHHGIARLWDTPLPLPPAVADYLAHIKRLNPDGKLRHYPGSPWLAAQNLRPEDRLRLFELHSTDARFLEKLFKDKGRQIQVKHEDGLEGLKAVLPPPPRRALVLIDPSFEVKTDYTAIPEALGDALKRFAQGVYMVWYPLLAKPDARRFPDRLKKVAGQTEWLHAVLQTHRAPDNGIGMYGSGLFIINPPWKLGESLEETLPWLADQLGTDASAAGLIEHSPKH